MYIENGLRPDQMAIGVPAAASAGGTGYISTDALKEVINSLVYKKELDGFTPPREYKTLRGVMTWSINWDGTQNYAWGKSMSELMDSLPIVDRGSERPEQDEKKSDETDDKESDNTSDSSEDEGTGDIPAWDSSKAYFKGDRVVYKGKIYEAKWWTQGDIPDEQDQWGPWKYMRDAGYLILVLFLN